MKNLILIFLTFGLALQAGAQQSKVDSTACKLLPDVSANLKSIVASAWRIANGDEACADALLDSLVAHYESDGDVKFLSAASSICNLRKEDEFSSHFAAIIEHLVQKDFERLINDFYLSRGQCACLEKELIGHLNMIVQGRPLKARYQGRLDVEIEKAQEKKDTPRVSYFNKLKQRIETERY